MTTVPWPRTWRPDRRAADGRPPAGAGDATAGGAVEERAAPGAADAPNAAEDARPRRRGGRRRADWVPVYHARMPEEAHVVAGRLEAEDIPALVSTDTMSNLGYAVIGRGATVLVPEALVDRARAVLDERKPGRRPGGESRA